MSALDTVDALNSLPIGSVIRGHAGGVWEVDDDETDGSEIRYRGAGVRDYYTSRILLDLYGPFICLWKPGATA